MAAISTRGKVVMHAPVVRPVLHLAARQGILRCARVSCAVPIEHTALQALSQWLRFFGVFLDGVVGACREA